MACCKMWTLALQMGALISVGAVLGFVDHTRRPVMVNPPEIAPPPPSNPVTSKVGEKTPDPAVPVTNPGGETPVNPTEQPKENPADTARTAPTPENPPAPAGEQIDPELVKQGHITVAQAFDLFNANPPAYFLDARRKEHYEAGHVRDAFRLPLEAFKGQEPAHMASMPREETYIVYCEGGNCDESVAVQKQLLLAAYKKVYVMHAGYPGWVAAGHPTAVGEDPIEAAEGRP